MIHVISIPKKDYAKSKINKLEIALGVLNQHNDACLCIDSSGDFYEVFVMNSTKMRAEQMKYFSIGFLQGFELE